MKKNNQRQYKIDAKGKSIGRVASETATILLGKNKPDFTPNMMANVKITIEHIKNISISPKKFEKTVFYRHSGYPGGLKQSNWETLFNKDPKKLFLKVIKNMLPANRHQGELLKKIKFE